MEDQNLTYTDLIKSKRVYGDIRYLTTSKSMGGGPANRGVQQKWTGQTGLHELLDRLQMRYYRSNIINPDINSYRYQGGYSVVILNKRLCIQTCSINCLLRTTPSAPSVLSHTGRRRQNL